MHPSLRVWQQRMGMRVLGRQDTRQLCAPSARARRAPVGPVRGAHDDDMRARLQPVHQRQQLRHDAALHLTLRPAAQADGKPCTTLMRERRLCLTPLLAPQQQNECQQAAPHGGAVCTSSMTPHAFVCDKVIGLAYRYRLGYSVAVLSVVPYVMTVGSTRPNTSVPQQRWARKRPHALMPRSSACGAARAG
jgi:hypothetical protein